METELEHAEPGAGFGVGMESGLAVIGLSGRWTEADFGFGVIGAVAGAACVWWERVEVRTVEFGLEIGLGVGSEDRVEGQDAEIQAQTWAVIWREFVVIVGE